jgi:GNAT superfamily N-acetyltransferase
VQVIHCICGARLEAESYDDLFAPLRVHSDEAHPEMQLTDEQLRQSLQKGAVTSRWDGRKAALAGDVQIKPLAAERLEDFLTFFDRDAFMDNPQWSSCYCLFYQYAGADWEQRTREENRATKASLISEGRAHGLLAYVDGRPVGWCHAAPKSTLPRIGQYEDLKSADDPTLGAIVCFVVAAPYRGQGLARKLLDAACDELRDLGMKEVEAYPPGESLSEARSYHGPLRMYLDAGFKVVGHDRDGDPIVRRSLSG